MYVTRHLSHLRKFPESISTLPEGPNSGYLVIQDQESETYSCFGLCKNHFLDDLPFPQNKELTVLFQTYQGEHSHTSFDDVVLIPVLDKPLSSNQYYAIQPHGKHIGEAFTSSTEDDKHTCCFCRCIKDIKPRPLDPHNGQQQFHISPHETMCTPKGYFYAKSVAPEAFPPSFLRRKGWSIKGKTPKKYQIVDAPGIYSTLLQVLPDFDFPISSKVSKPIVVGKWYCPFMFIRDGTLREQVKESLFYEMTLERKWEQIFACRNKNNEGNSVFVNVDVAKEVVYLGGNKVVCDVHNVSDGVMWFRNSGNKGGQPSVGLRMEIVDRMKWEQQKNGFISSEANQVRVSKKEFGEGMGWNEFGCYVLVESFVLKKMDGSTILTYDFMHTHQIKSKWE
ncbi:hypothetical protein Leryth_012503 [Lithospermum erythrorhizon]|nr:hypothetical protein Leryth_012503 [Lithospermum erythrorhizon]